MNDNQGILSTKPNTSERAHIIENIIDTYINLYAEDFEEFDIQGLDYVRQLKMNLKHSTTIHRTIILLLELKKVVIEISKDTTITAIPTVGGYTVRCNIDYERIEKHYKVRNQYDALELFINYLEKRV